MDMHETAFCACCGEQTVHQRLGQGRLECTDCHETRDGGPLQMWDPASLDPSCPTCHGAGGTARTDTTPWIDCATCYGTGWVRSVDLPIEGEPA